MLKIPAILCAAIAAGLLQLPTAAFAAPTDYQVTGPVTEVTDTTITVEKGKEKWQLAKDANTKAATAPKVGDKVTVHYTMTASEIEVKPAAPEKAEKAEKPKKK